MGLFGLVATLFTVGNLTKDCFRNAYFDGQSKQDAISNKQYTWTDSHGTERLLSTNEKVYRHDGCIRSVKTGQTIIDVKKEEYKKYVEQWKENVRKSGYLGDHMIYQEFDRAYYTELSTMRRCYVSAKWDSKENRGRFYKHYFGYGKRFSDISNDEKYEITREEYEKMDRHFLGDNYLKRERAIYKYQ